MADDSVGVTGIREEQVWAKITSAKKRLYDKLIHIDPKSLGISEYNQRYLRTKIRYAEATLDLYGKLIFLALGNLSIPPEQFTLVDYGGGSGLIALLALESGIGTVIYNDIYEVSCNDVKKLSREFGLPLEHVFPGDVEELVEELKRSSVRVDAIISNDVLEHIYDIDSHFRTLVSLADHPFRVVYATGANIRNYRYVREARKKQIEVEYQSREPSWGHKERDTLQAYLDVRKNLISKYAPELDADQVDLLAQSTRGLMKSDIEKCVDEFREKGTISYHPNHPTNTCDPHTGNWCEHLMEFDWLEQVVTDAGFSASIFPGSYFVSGPIHKRIAKRILNSLFRIFGQGSMFLAPYFILLAEAPDVGDE